MNACDRASLTALFVKCVDKSSRILDVGCGIGENMNLLKEIGFANVVGVDVCGDMVDESRRSGHLAFLVEDLRENDFDVILMSHVIEHVGYPEIVRFLEYYFARAKSNAIVVIITPVFYNAFFNDIDHIKPYFPDGLMMLFSARAISRQYKSDYSLTLEEIRFRRSPLTPYHLKCRYSRGLAGRLLFRSICVLFAVLRLLSLDLLSRVTGYAAIFRLGRNGRKPI